MKKRSFALVNYNQPDLFGNWLGYKVLSADSKRHVAKTSLKLRDEHLSPAGKIHGGVVSAFLDFSCGAAVFTTLGKNDYCSTVELKVNYFKPLLSGDHLVATSTVVFRGKRICVVHSMVRRKADKLVVAMATATFNIVSDSKP
jgi:acyl-CoA thioesterase